MTVDRSFSAESITLPRETWYEWSPEAFEVARARNVPVLLVVMAAWATPWRDAARLLAQNEELDAWLREHLVAVVVDADERPDLAERYASGVLPVAQFLTPDGDPLATIDSIDAEAIRAAGESLLASWADDREDMLHEVESERVMRAAERATALARRSPGMLTPSMLDGALELLDEADLATLHATDVAEAIRLWVYAHQRRGTPGALERARQAATVLLDGALTEDEFGAVHHSRENRGLAAADQATVLLALADLAIADEEAREDFADQVEQLARFVIDVLGEPYGGIRHTARELDPAAAEERVFVTSSARAARALIMAGTIYGNREWVERGRRAVDFLLERVRAGEAGFYHQWDGTPGGFGFLGDQAEVLLSVLQAYEVSGTGTYLEHARRLVRIVERDWREPGRGFRDLSELNDADSLEQGGLLTEMHLPLDQNVSMAEGLVWLARLTHDERLLDIAVDTLVMFATGLEQRGVSSVRYVRTVDRILSAEPEIKIIAEQPPGEPDRVADPLMDAAMRLPVAGRTVQRLAIGIDDDLIDLLGLPRNGGRAAYVCIGSSCSAPLTQPEQLLPAVEEMVETQTG